MSNEITEKYIKKLFEYVDRSLDENDLDNAKKHFSTLIGNTILKKKVNNYEEKRAKKKKDVQTDSYLAHYTNVETIYSILKGYEKEIFFNKNNKNQEKQIFDSSYLRLYDAFSLNDPNEGIHLKNKLQKDYGWLKHIEKDTDIEAFVCSFVHGDSNIGDQLRYWQSYGKDGLGCSIQIRLTSDQKIFSPVSYGDGIKDIKAKFKPYFNLLDRFYKERKKEEIRIHFIKEFWKAFDKMKFLYKDISYKSEDEFRCVAFPNQTLKLKTEADSWSTSDIKYHFKTEGPYLRKFILHPELKANKILVSGTKITIGPRVKDPERMCQNLKNIAVKLNLHGPNFISSEISYQKVW